MEDIKKIQEFFSKPLNEMDMNDPVMMKIRAAKMKADKLAKMRAANAGDDGNDKFFDNAKKIAFLKKERAQLMRDMEQEAEPEGGPIADEYGSKLNRIDAAIAKLSGRKEMTYDQAIAEDKSLKKGDIVKFKDGSSIYILGPKGDGYDYKDGREKGHHPKGWFDMMISSGKAVIAEGKGKMPTQDQVDRFFALTQNETHYLNSKPVAGQEATFNLMKVEPWDEYDLSNWNSLVRKAKQRGKSIDEGNDKIKDLEQLFDFHTQMDNKGQASIIKDKIEKLRKLSNSGEINGDEFLDKFNPLQKQLKSIDEDNSYARVSKPRFKKDKNNPNFLNVYIDYDLGPGGNSIAFGKETMSGQIRRLSSEKARKIAHDIALDLEANFNLEDIEVTDLENGKVRIFAVSDDFVAVGASGPDNFNDAMNDLLLKENTLLKQAKLSSAEYQKAKKLKDFNKDDYKWNPGESLYVKLNESIAQTLAETIKLGEGVIEEELCPKGKAYIKRRKAAGEKSSAYLSGRAVKVCKGQMSGRKKKKKK
jgi:hypothetical protein